MDVIYGLIPGMILLGLVAVAVFFWAARSGQYDDLEGEAHRILMDEDLTEDGEAKASGEEKASGQKKAEPAREKTETEPGRGPSRD